MLTDAVEKVEKRTTLTISQTVIFELLRCCDALQCQYEGPRSFFRDTMWSLTSPRTKRIGSFRKFRLLPPKDFFDSIDPSRKSGAQFCNKVTSGKLASPAPKEIYPSCWTAFSMQQPTTSGSRRFWSKWVSIRTT